MSTRHGEDASAPGVRPAHRPSGLPYLRRIRNPRRSHRLRTDQVAPPLTAEPVCAKFLAKDALICHRYPAAEERAPDTGWYQRVRTGSPSRPRVPVLRECPPPSSGPHPATEAPFHVVAGGVLLAAPGPGGGTGSRKNRVVQGRPVRGLCRCGERVSASTRPWLPVLPPPADRIRGHVRADIRDRLQGTGPSAITRRSPSRSLRPPGCSRLQALATGRPHSIPLCRRAAQRGAEPDIDLVRSFHGRSGRL